MAKTILRNLRYLTLVCFIIFGLVTIIASTGGGDGNIPAGDNGGGGTNPLVGVWKFVSIQGYDESDDECYSVTADSLIDEHYYKLTNDTAASHIKDKDQNVYYCTEEGGPYTVSGNTFHPEGGKPMNFSVSGNTITLTRNLVEGCQEVMVLAKVDESEIANATEDCSLNYL